MWVRDLALRWTPSVFEKPQVTYRTSKSTVGSASMRPLPYLPRFLFDADSEIAPQTIYWFLCIGPTTGFCSPLSQRNPGPSPWTSNDWNYVYYMWQIPHHTPKTPGCYETCTRIATGWHVGHMPSVAIHVIPHWSHWHRIPCIGPTTGGTSCRGGFVMPCCCTTGRAHIALLPNTFHPHTFLTSLGRTTKSQLWPIRHWGGEALHSPYL